MGVIRVAKQKVGDWKDKKGYAVTIPNQGAVTLEKLFKLTYQGAHKVIKKIKAEDRLVFTEEIEKEVLPPLYEGVQLYKDGIPKEGDIYVSPARYIQLMNMIKHWEQLLEWLYEVELGWLDQILQMELAEALLDDTLTTNTGGIL